MKLKPFITNGIALLLLLAMAFLFYKALQGVTSPAISPSTFSDFSNALWGTWGVTILIVAFIIFAGGTGILVLLGGGWRWE